MTKTEIKNLPASVRQRLTNIADSRGEPLHRMLVHYGLERLLYRLSRSKQRERFVLKGALLFSLWSHTPQRPTMDADLMSAVDTDEAELVAAFRAICTTPVENDGLVFVPESVRGEEIREAHAYSGVRIKLLATLGNIRINLQVDIGFADAITPGPVELEYPALLEFAAPRLRTYPKETVVAEKLEATVSLGMTNSRMKDFYDLWMLARQFKFDGETLSRAIRNTFDRRRTELPSVSPVALPERFVADAVKRKQWSSFLAKAGIEKPALPEVAKLMEVFLSGPTLAAARREAFRTKWTPPGPWRDSKSK